MEELNKLNISEAENILKEWAVFTPTDEIWRKIIKLSIAQVEIHKNVEFLDYVNKTIKHWDDTIRKKSSSSSAPNYILKISRYLQYYRRSQTTLSSFKTVEEYSYIKRLEFHRCEWVRGIENLTNTPHLQNLEYLRIHDTCFIGGSLKELMAAKWMKNLKFLYLGKIDDHQFLPALLERTDMNQLESLTLYELGSELSNEKLMNHLIQFLSYCKVKHLNLSKTIYSSPKTNFFLKKLSKSQVLKGLESLNLCTYIIGGSSNRNYCQKEIQILRNSRFCNKNLKILMDWNDEV